MNIVEISIYDVLLSAILVLVVIVTSILYRLGLSKDVVIGSIRTFIQLIAVGYVLDFIFKSDEWYYVVLILSLMIIVAGYNAYKRVGTHRHFLIVINVVSILLGSVFVLIFVTQLVIDTQVWYQPQYVIPIAGMIINGSMTGLAIGQSSLKTIITDNRETVEVYLSLGASYGVAVKPFYKEALKKALIPTINSLMVAGIVQLPGMMTGQIISGTDPKLAVLYQIVVYYMLASASMISTLIGLQMYSKTFFTKNHQLHWWV